MTEATRSRSLLSRILSVRTGSLEFGAFGDFVGSGSDETRDVERRVDPVAGEPVRVSNVNGEVAVRPADGDVVEVDGTVRTKGRRSSLDSVTVHVDRTPEGVVVDVDHEDRGGLFSFGKDVLVDLEVRVPEGVSVASVETVNGDVRAEGVRAIRRAESTNGSVDVAVKSVECDLVAETTTGSVTVRLPADVDCELELNTTLGDTAVERLPAEGGSGGWGPDRMQVGAGGPERVRVSTTTGSITILAE